MMLDTAPPVRSVPELTVVLASDGDGGDLSAALAAVATSCRGLRVQLVVAHQASEAVPVSAAEAVDVSSVAVDSALVPVLWGHGMMAATGTIVALTTSQFRVSECWARELLTAFPTETVCAVGGRLAIAPAASLLTRAVFFIRYSEHMGAADVFDPREIAGDNAAYRRADVLRASSALEHGFWEVVVHRTLRSLGHTLRWAPLAVSYFVARPAWSRVLVNRFVHGTHYGEYRVRELGWPRWRALVVAPAVPFVLLWRIIRRIRRSEYALHSNLLVLPVMLVVLMAWAAGEARGAWRVRTGHPA